MKKNKGLANEGYDAKEEETPEKPYLREKSRERGNKEMRRKSANARKYTDPGSYISTKSQEKEPSKKKNHTFE